MFLAKDKIHILLHISLGSVELSHFYAMELHSMESHLVVLLFNY